MFWPELIEDGLRFGFEVFHIPPPHAGERFSRSL